MFGRAVEERASDVYLDVRRDRALLAFRTYGFKRPFDEISRDDGLALARSIWALGTNAQFDESGVCDVAFDFEHGGRLYRIRGNSMKEVRGNSVVCRVRDPSFVLPLGKSGYAPVQVRQIERMCRAPGGLILITGETNSGKSTTLASLMAAMPATQKVIEVADPVEVVMNHVTHVEIEHYGDDAEQRLRENLAALVRQNPDTLVLGEIRDEASATAAKDMAIQGKRVLSTLHTQSCVAAVPRLVNLGVPPSLLGARAFLAGIVNQNLFPVVCPSCGLAKHPDPNVDARYRSLFGDRVRFLNATGCDGCRDGVVGQTLVAEVYPLCLDRSGRAHDLVGAGRLAELERYMRRNGADGHGCISKHRHAAGKVATGEIDPEQTERIIGEFGGEDLEDRCGELVELRRLGSRGRGASCSIVSWPPSCAPAWPSARHSRRWKRRSGSTRFPELWPGRRVRLSTRAVWWPTALSRTRSVPLDEVGLVRVAERLGTMVDAFEDLGRARSARLRIARNVLAPNGYYLVSLAIAVAGAMQLEDMLGSVLGHDVLAENGAYMLSRWLNDWAPLGIGAVLAVAAGVLAGRQWWHGRARRLLWFFDVEHRARVALQFAEFAARLYGRGATHADVLDAYADAHAHGGFVRWAIREVRRDHVDAGMSIEDALAGRLVPEWLAGVLSAMVPGGRRDLYPGAWEALGKMQRSLLEARLRTASAMVRAVAIGAIGLLIAVVVPGIYSAYTVPI